MGEVETRLRSAASASPARAPRSRSRTRSPRGPWRPSARPRTSSSTPRSPPPPRRSASWERTPAVERGELLHEVATRLRARTDELAELMTLEGGKPLVENSDEIGWTAAAFDYYAEIGRDSAGRVIPPIEASQLALVVKDPVGPVGCIVPWNYPLLLLVLEARAGARRGQRHRLQAVGADPALDPRRRLVLRPPARRGRQRRRRRRRRRRRDRRRRADRVRRVHRARSRPASGSPRCAPSASPASTSRWAARTPSSSAPTSPTRSTSPPAAAPGPRSSTPARSAPRRSASTSLDDVYDDYLQAFTDHTRTLRIGDPMDPATDVGPMVSATQRAKVADQVEAAVAAGAELVVGGDAAGHDRGHFFAPAVVTGRRGRHRPALRGDLRPGGAAGARALARRGDRATRTRPASGSAPTSTPRTCRRCCAACASSRPGRCGSTTR